MVMQNQILRVKDWVEAERCELLAGVLGKMLTHLVAGCFSRKLRVEEMASAAWDEAS